MLIFSVSKLMAVRSDVQVSLKWAICVPKSCTAEKLNEYFAIVLRKYNFSINFDKDRCSVMHDPVYSVADCFVM